MGITHSGVEETARELERIATEAVKAQTQAVNEAGKFAERQMVSALSRDTGLGQRRIRSMRKYGVTTTPATGEDPVYTLTVGPRALQIISLRARQTGSGVQYRLRGSRTLPGAFVQERLKKGIGVAEREGRPRLPITRLFAPEALSDLAQDHVADVVSATETELQQRLESRLVAITARDS